MGLFQRNVFDNDRPLYEIVDTKTTSQSSLIDRTFLVVGLGNPGKEYALTRHNSGFMAVDNFATTSGFEPFKPKKDLKCEVSSGVIGSSRVIVIKPQTFMNDSGQAVQAIQKFYKLTNADTVVVYDELAQNFSKIRSRKGGGAAGHNGIKSIIQHCGNDFNRIRIGIRNDITEKADQSDFVLGKFTKTEQTNLPAILEATAELLKGYIDLGALIPETIEV